ncbi:MAG: hypothetical protein ABFD79_15250 [Phycisphaerales bacterium]
MKNGIKLCVAFICGAIIGILLYVDIFSEKTQTGILTSPVKYGDITITPKKYPEDNKALICIQRNNGHFAAIYQDANGMSINASFFNKKGEIISYLSTKNELSGRWMHYSGLKGQERYIDINLDGQFDSKYIRDGNELNQRWIFFDNHWIEVERANFEMARDAENNYYFENDEGWVKDTNSI